MKVVDLSAEVEFVKGKVEHAGDEAKGQGIQAGFKIFHQLTLQLYPDFDIGALRLSSH